MAGNGWNRLEMSGIIENGWKLLEMVKMTRISQYLKLFDMSRR